MIPSMLRFQLTGRKGRLYYVNGAINILTDIVIIAIPALIVFNIQIKKREQWAISLIFGLRILYVTFNSTLL